MSAPLTPNSGHQPSAKASAPQTEVRAEGLPAVPAMKSEASSEVAQQDSQIQQTRAFMRAVQLETEKLIEMEQGELLEHVDAPKFGHEAEYFLVNPATLEPLGLAPDILGAAMRNPDLSLTGEMGKFQIERLGPVLDNFGGESLQRIETAMNRDFSELNKLASQAGGIAVPTGMLPTITASHLCQEMMLGDGKGRYAEASRAAVLSRGGKWDIVIPCTASCAEEPVSYTVENTMSVAQTCALQPHIQCAPEEFVPLYNAFLLSAGFALAPATASPIVQGKVAQMESRIEAFEQAWLAGRVFLATDYVKTISQLFVENATAFGPVFTDIQDSDMAGIQLNNLRLQNGSIHRWVRPVYDFNPQPHVRIELRTLPMSAAPRDNVANIAWAVGLAYGFAKLGKENPNTSLCIERAKHNFKSAAQHGLQSKVWIPGSNDILPYSECQNTLCDIAREGLAEAGVDDDVAERYISTIAARFNVADARAEPQPQTESDWIIRSLASLTSPKNQAPLSQGEALAIITYELHTAAVRNVPAHEREILRVPQL